LRRRFDRLERNRLARFCFESNCRWLGDDFDGPISNGLLSHEWSLPLSLARRDDNRLVLVPKTKQWRKKKAAIEAAFFFDTTSNFQMTGTVARQ
jgi:hypothetical protein